MTYVTIHKAVHAHRQLAIYAKDVFLPAFVVLTLVLWLRLVQDLIIDLLHCYISPKLCNLGLLTFARAWLVFHRILVIGAEESRAMLIRTFPYFTNDDIVAGDALTALVHDLIIFI